MSLLSRLAPVGGGLGSAEDATAGLDLRGKHVLVTGVSSGLGEETMRVLRLRGAHVLGTARTEGQAREAGARHRGGELTPLGCELTDVRSVRSCVDAVLATGLTLDAIVANAGVAGPAEVRRAHGYERQFFVNHLAHFLLVRGLLERLAVAGRVVVVTSDAHRIAPEGGICFDDLAAERGYRALPWYAHSKLANLLFAKALARRFDGTRRTANAVHPGIVRTKLGREGAGLAMRVLLGALDRLAARPVGRGAAAQCWAAVHPDAARHHGAYLFDGREVEPSAHARDPELAERLWRRSEEIVAAL
jgi:NAD(P)-dependent dehydrogenase (short-subunit alcohol dehydrogenase family)